MTSPAFRRKLEALPNSSVGFSDAPESSAIRRGDFEDAAAAFKARALAFVSLRSTADEHRAMNGVLEALAALAAGERETRRLFFSQNEKSPGDGEKNDRLKNAPPAVAANQDATREPIEPAYSLCLECVLDVLFMPNSRPLHRAIVTAPRAFPPRARDDAYEALVGALGDRVAAAREPFFRKTASGDGHGAARLRVLGVVFSVASCQPQTAADRRVVRAVAVDAAALIGEGAAPRRFFSSSLREGSLSVSPVASNAKRPRHPKMRRLERDEFSFQKLELPSQARMFGAMEPGPLGAVANGFT